MIMAQTRTKKKKKPKKVYVRKRRKSAKRKKQLSRASNYIPPLKTDIAWKMCVWSIVHAAVTVAGSRAALAGALDVSIDCISKMVLRKRQPTLRQFVDLLIYLNML